VHVRLSEKRPHSSIDEGLKGGRDFGERSTTRGYQKDWHKGCENSSVYIHDSVHKGP